MSGKRLYDFRSGDRSEYMAVFGLSRVAFVTPVPRQEDFGVVDLRCVLAKKDGDSVYPKSAFNVQVKSSKKDLNLDAGQIKWITTNMDCPLFLCISDKAETKLTLYSCSRLWLALFLRMIPARIKLRLDDYGPDPPYIFTQSGPEDIEGKFEVFLGPPLLDLDITDLERDPSIGFDVLNEWIQLDIGNIARMRLGRCAVRYFSQWEPNVIPTGGIKEAYYHRNPHQHNLDLEVIPFLVSLGFCYKRIGNEGNVTAVCEMLKALDPLLNDYQRGLVENRFPLQ
jgi:hypothetical protein